MIIDISDDVIFGTNGGPILCAPVSALPHWQGTSQTNSSSRPSYFASDYVYACRYRNLTNIINIAEKEALTFPLEGGLTWVRDEKSMYFVEFITLGEFKNSKLSIELDECDFDAGLDLKLPHEEFCIFDSAYPGEEPIIGQGAGELEAPKVEFPSGWCNFSASELTLYKDDEFLETEMIIRRLQPLRAPQANLYSMARGIGF